MAQKVIWKEGEREEIKRLRDFGYSLNLISEKSGRSASTISRLLRPPKKRSFPIDEAILERLTNLEQQVEIILDTFKEKHE